MWRSAILLIAIVRLPAADWQVLLDIGLAAEDEGAYERATAPLATACRESIVDPHAMRESCSALARVHAVAGNLGDADKVAADLVSRLRALDSPADTVKALLLWSEVRAARSRLEDAVGRLREAGSFMGRLSPVERAHALTEIGDLYLTIDLARAGMRVLYRVQAELLSSLPLDDPGAVEALAENASVLIRNERREEAEAVLVPIIKAARQAFSNANLIPDELYEGYIGACGQYARLLSRQGKKKEHQAFQAELEQWRRNDDSNDEDTLKVVPGVVEPPRLLKKIEPTYTRGAHAAGAEGTVILGVSIWPDGKAHSIEVRRRLGYGLTWNAIAAVRKWRFAPATKEGKPVKISAQIEVRFRKR